MLECQQAYVKEAVEIHLREAQGNADAEDLVPRVQTNNGIAFAFSGLGSQWATMGADLLEEECVRDVFSECEACLQPYGVEWSLTAELSKDASQSLLLREELASYWIFSLQVALVALLRKWGIVPSAVIGHSVGEVSAAYIVGILSLSEAFEILWQDNQVLKSMGGQGRMAHLSLAAGSVEQLLIKYPPDAVCISAVNSPSGTVVVGETQVVQDIVGNLKKDGVFCRLLSITKLLHTPAVEQYREDLQRTYGALRPRAPQVPIYSSLLGRRGYGNDFQGVYWVEHIRQRVLFSQAVEAMIDDGHQCVLDVGPRPVLTTYLHEIFHAQRSEAPLIIGTLRRGELGKTSLLRTASILEKHCYPTSHAG